MSAAAPPLAMERPDIIVPDAAPLIHLSQADALGLLHGIGAKVVIVDMVRHEITHDPEKPEARRLQDWLEAGLAPGSNRPVQLGLTETGEAFRLARLVKPDFRMRDGGGTAIVQWLAETVENTPHQAIVLYENGKVPKVVRREALDADIDVMTTRAFLQLAERRGLIASAEAVWRRTSPRRPQPIPISKSIRIADPAETANDSLRLGGERDQCKTIFYNYGICAILNAGSANDRKLSPQGPAAAV